VKLLAAVRSDIPALNGIAEPKGDYRRKSETGERGVTLFL
jgi:hypothetical protein